MKAVSGIVVTLIAISILALVFNIQVSTRASPDPDWLDGWSYRKSHVINSVSGAGANYQINIKVHYGSGTDNGSDVYLNYNSRADFGDVRFTDDDGTTELDYWMQEKVDDDYAIFWVEVADDLSSNNQTIYVYYGNSSVSTTSNGTNTFIFFDDFSGPSLDTDKWELLQGDVGIANSSLEITGTTGTRGSIRTWETFSYGVALHSKARGSDANQVTQRWHHMNVGSGSPTINSLEVYGWHYDNQIRYTTRNSYFDLEQTVVTIPDFTTWNLFETRWTSGEATYLVDEEVKAIHTTYVPTTDLHIKFTEGNVDCGTVYTDWIFLRKFPDPEPAPGLVTEVVYPSDDSYVKRQRYSDGVWTDTSDWNYGDEPTLIVCTTTVDDREGRTFLKFSLSSLHSPEDIDSVELFLFKTGEYPSGWGGVGNVEAREVIDDSWTEENITWNNQPAFGGLLDTTYIVFGSSQWYSWNVTSFILDELAGDEVASVCLKAENEDGGNTLRWSKFWSKEYDGFDPCLLVTYKLPTSNVKVYVDMPLGYIPGAPPGDLVSVDLYIDTDIIDDTPDGIVQWAVSAQVDPTVLEPMGVLGAAPGYFLYDYLIRSGLSDMGYITGSVLYGVDKAAGKIYWITEAILPSPPTGAGAVPGQMPYKLCTLTFKSLSETAYSPIDLFYEEGVDAWYRTPDGVSHAVDLVEDGHYNARANVKVYVDQPLGYIPGVPVGDSFVVDVIIEVSNITDFSAEGMVGWGLSLAVDPDVLNITGAIGAASGYFLWEFADAWSEPYPIQLFNINATAGLADVTEQIIPSPLGGAGDPWSGLKLVTLAFTSKSETAHALIDLVNVEYMTPDGLWHLVDEVVDGYYNPPPAPDLSVEGIVLPYISYVPLIYPTPDPGFAYRINATVVNEGTADAGSFNVSFSVYLNGTEVPEYGRKKPLSGLAQGASETVWFDFSPENYGNYTLIIGVDCDNDIVELDETNNEKMAWVKGTVRGDVDGDGDVDWVDFGTFATDYGKTFEHPPYPSTDLDYDGDVDWYDFGTFAQNFGQTV